MIDNLHSLLNRPWYIERHFAEAQLPLLLNIINGTLKVEERKPELITSYYDVKGNRLNTTEGRTDGVVAKINIKNSIFKYSQFCGPQGTKDIAKEMRGLEADSTVIGVVLDIDSGGGQVSGTPEFYDFIQAFSKPVVAYTDGWMCSAAYYIGSATDYIVANKRAEAIGSIGAYSQFMDLQGFYEKKGAKLHTIYSSKSTEKNQAYREALEGNYDKWVKEELDPIVDDFIADMKAARPNLSEAVFKGATFGASKSLKLGLIDELGTLATAINKVTSLSKQNNNNKNSNNMSKERSQLQGVLDLDAPLAATDDNGSYLNEDQLDAVETALASNASALQTAEDAKATAEDHLKTAQQDATDLNTKINALATKAGVEASETVADTLTAIENKIEELGQAPGDTHTNVGKGADEAQNQHEYMDFDTPFYNKAKELLN